MSQFTPSELPIQDVACTLCGCVCDDLKIRVQGGRLVEAENACELARPFLLKQTSHAHWPAYHHGAECTPETAIREAADILKSSRAPLIYGLSRSSTSGQRAAVRLADSLGATIDTTASRCHAPSIVALQQAGENTCTLGEARHRCDLVIFWGSNPAVSHPRHGERYSLTPGGEFLPNGRLDRKVVVVDTQKTETTEIADFWLKLPPGGDFDVIWALRSLVGGQVPCRWPKGVGIEAIQKLASLMTHCRSGIVYFGLGLTRHGPPHANVEALLRLVTDMNSKTRFYARRMRIPGDVAGADSVLCWQTGFPFSVNFSRGFPRYGPGEYSANEILERREADCCLFVGSEGFEKLSASAQAHVRAIPTIVLDYPSETPAFSPKVRFTTAVYGIHQHGTAYRMDETPIPLKPVLPCGEGNTDADILDKILKQLENLDHLSHEIR